MIKPLAKKIIPRSTWAKLVKLRENVRAAYIPGGPDLRKHLILSFTLDRFLSRVPGRARRVRRLNLRGYSFPIYYRPGSSDLDVIRQVFLRREYDCVAHEQNVALIIDCGANIGCTTFFFLHHYPSARVIVVEPDPGNFAICQRNLQPFADRVVLINSAVWPTALPLRVARGCYGDGREWSFQVRPAVDGERADLTAKTVFDLIESSGRDEVDLLKIDIERTEVELFSQNTDRWLPRTRRVAIELHGTECENVFFEAMAEYQPDVQRSGELTICRNLRARVPVNC